MDKPEYYDQLLYIRCFSNSGYPGIPLVSLSPLISTPKMKIVLDDNLGSLAPVFAGTPGFAESEVYDQFEDPLVNPFCEQ